MASADEGYPIVRFSNIKIHKPTAEYLMSQVPLANKHQIEDKSTSCLSLVPYDPNIHFAPKHKPDLDWDTEFRMDIE